MHVQETFGQFELFIQFFGGRVSVIQKRGRTPTSLFVCRRPGTWHWFIPSRWGISELRIANCFSKRHSLLRRTVLAASTSNACWKFNVALIRLPPSERSAPWQMGRCTDDVWASLEREPRDLLEWMRRILLRLLACTKVLRGFLNSYAAAVRSAGWTVGGVRVLRLMERKVFRCTKSLTGGDFF